MKKEEESWQQQKRTILRVWLRLNCFKDKDKYSEDVTVVVNGTTFRIQRGVEVEVPYYVAEVLRNSEKADEETETKISELVAKNESN